MGRAVHVAHYQQFAVGIAAQDRIDGFPERSERPKPIRSAVQLRGQVGADQRQRFSVEQSVDDEQLAGKSRPGDLTDAPGEKQTSAVQQRDVHTAPVGRVPVNVVVVGGMCYNKYGGCINMSNETQADLTNNNSVKSNKDTKGKKKFSYAYILIGIIVVLGIVMIIMSNKPQVVSFNTPGYIGSKINSVRITDTKNGSIIDEPKLDLTNKPYYDFLGWYDNAAGEGEPIDFTTHRFLTSITLYSVFVPTTYTITYELDGGENNSENPTTYTIKTQQLNIVDPTKVDATFDCWEFQGNKYSSLELSNVLMKYLEKPENIILKAIWK